MRTALPFALLLAVAVPAAAEDPPATSTTIPLDIKDASGNQLSGDPGKTKGESEFKKCEVCHTLEEGVNKVGPSLHKIIGRTAGSVEGFNYSKANKESGIVWTEQKMWEYLEKPAGFMPGTKMAFAGIKDGQKRADLIAYIQEHSK